MGMQFAPGRLSVSEAKILRAVCRDSFFEFVREFWSVVVPNEPHWNWHIPYLCQEYEVVVKRILEGKPKLYDLVNNQPPGTTKSVLASIMLPAWGMAMDPGFRYIGGSFSFPLQQDLSRKTRDVMQSEKYRECFPDTQIRDDQNTKAYFATTRGGFRLGVGAGGAVTGFHAHLICLPWEAKVVTDLGELPIGRVVDNRMRVNIMTFDHAAGTTRWQPIERYESQPGRPLCRINFADGGRLELTGDHQVFVLGRGYVDPVDLNAGDVVYDCRAENETDDVRPVREGVPLSDGPARPSADRRRDGQGVLLLEVPAGTAEAAPAALPGVWNGVRPAHPQILFGEMPGVGDEGRQAPPDGRNVDRPVPPLRRSGDETPATGGGRTQAEVLLGGVSDQSPLQPDAGGGEFQLPARHEFVPVLPGVRPEAEGDQAAGRAQVHEVWTDGEAGRQAGVRPPHRLHEDEQPANEPDLPVQGVPRGVSPTEHPTPAGLRQRVVRSVDRNVRIPDQVYNLRVAEDHNYFAEGVLVHNCIDDPLDPEEAYSPTDLHRVNRWVRETLSSRKVDKEVSVMLLVMQRLNMDDPTAQFLLRKDIRHLCFPAEASDQIQPAGLRAFYRQGLLDPKRLSRKVLREAEQQFGQYGFAAQFRQTPVPPGGGMFQVQKIPVVTGLGGGDRFVSRCRFWDKAGTSRGGAYTVGVLMGLTRRGLYVVEDVIRVQVNSHAREALIRKTAETDGRAVTVGIEREPGSGGMESAELSVRSLAGFKVKVSRVDTGKVDRADTFSVQVNGANVVLLLADWNRDFTDELKYFPFSKYKDQVDASSGAFAILARPRLRAGAIR